MKKSILKKISFFAVFLIFIAGCSDKEEIGKGGINGTVTDKETGSPLGNVAVVLDDGKMSVTTDSDGKYYFKDLEYGKYTLEFKLEGYGGIKKDVTIENGSVTLDIDMSPDKKEINKGEINGTVIDKETGYSLTNVAVVLDDGEMSTTTNSSGKYYFKDLEYGKYTLEFKLEGYGGLKKKVTIESASVTVDIDMSPINGGINGTVTDRQTGYSLANVVVVLDDGKMSTTTNSSGRYYFENLTYGKYTLEFKLDGYEGLKKDVTLESASAILDIDMSPILKEPSTASVIINDYMAISDGIYYSFTPSNNTRKYYWAQFRTSDFPTSNENQIISYVLSEGIEMDALAYEKQGYGYNMQANTSYTVCMVAVDFEGNAGKLNTREVKTKPSVNQPEAVININSQSGSTIYFSATKNRYCSYYVLVGFENLSSLNQPNIVWAQRCYEAYLKGEERLTADVNVEWKGWSNGTHLLVTLGFSTSTYSGVINSKTFTVGTRSTLTPNSDLPKKEMYQKDDMQVKQDFIRFMPAE